MQNAQATFDRYPDASGCCADQAARDAGVVVNPYVRNAFLRRISAFGTGVASGRRTDARLIAIAGAVGTCTSMFDEESISIVATAVCRNAPLWTRPPLIEKVMAPVAICGKRICPRASVVYVDCVLL